MARTESFRKQHDDLALALQKIESMIKASPLNATELSQLLASVAGKINMHLAMEDQSLYPAMLKSNNTKVVEAAKKFQAEMGGLKEVFVKFCQEWGIASKISANEDGFRTQMTGIIAALRKRVAKENTELYPLADQI